MFSKLFKNSSNIKADEPVQRLPDRFSFMPLEEQLHFQDEVTKYFQRNYPNLKVDFGKGAVLEQEPSKTKYGLDSVGQLYHSVDKEEKKNVIKKHFDSLFRGKKEEEAILKDSADFQKMKKLLAVRLYPPDYEPKVYERLMQRQDIEGIVTVLVLDLPSTAKTVRPEDTKQWGVTIDELFRIAFANTFKNNKVEVKKVDFVGNLALWLLEDESIYTATFALNLDKFPQLIGTYGSLVIIPHRHAVVIHPIEDESVIKMTNHLPVMATNMFKEGPGSISPNMYWFYKGRYTNIPYMLDFEKKSLNITPPEKFVEMMNQLTAKTQSVHLDKIQAMFEKMKTEAKWNMSKPMLWGYFFLNTDKQKLEELATLLSKKNFEVVDISNTDDKKSYRLHIEERSIHTPESLLKQIHDFEKLAKEHAVLAFDGWDVGLITN